MKILLVDDDAGFRESVARALESRGWEVEQAATSQAALDAMTDYAYEVVITDWDLNLLSEMNGDALAKMVKFGWPTTGVLLWSGLTRPPCEHADSQITKDDIDSLFDFLAYEKGVRE